MSMFFFFFSSRRRHTRLTCDWSSDVCSSDLGARHPRRRRLNARSPRAPAAEGAPVPEALVSDAPAEIAPVRSGEALDWAALETWLRPRLAEVLPEAQGPIEVLQFPNGSANLTYLLRVGTTELVLRRPPFGQIAPGAHDMKREFRVLSQLWRHFDRAPRAYVFCDDSAVLGVDFFVMERRRGEVVRTRIPDAMRHYADAGRRMGLAL